MVDAGDEIPHPFDPVLHADRAEQRGGTDLDAVAQADRADARIALHIAGKDGHGIRVVEEERVRTDLFHVPGEIFHDGDRAQASHDAADPQRVADRLAKAVFLGHFEVDDRAGIIQADLDRVHDEIGASQRVLPVLRAQESGDAAVSAFGFPHGLQDRPALLQPLPVDVVQSEFRVPQDFGTHAVPDDVPGKHGAARTHKCDLHSFSSSIR